MTMMLRFLLIAYLLLTCFLSISAEESERFFSRYNFQYLTEGDGMPYGVVDDIIADSDGFIWIATSNGIGRYDGYQVITYNSQTHPLKLKNDFVHRLCEDNFRRLWIGTENGLELIDLNTYQTIDWQTATDDTLHSLAHEYIHTIYRDKTGDMWVSAGNDLWCIELDEQGKMDGYYQLGNLYSTPVLAVSNVGENICAGLDNQVYVLHKQPEHRLKAVRLSEDLLPYSDDWRISCILEDGDFLWMGSNRGLFRYNLKTHQMKRYRYSTHRPGMLSQAYITDMGMTGQGHLIVTTLNGVNVYRRETDDFAFIRRNSAPGLNGGSINCDAINCVYTRGESIWLGTETGGVNLLSLKRLQAEWWDVGTFAPVPGNNPPVNAIGEDREGNIWIGLMERGLACWNPETSHCRRYVFAPNDITTLSNNTINGLLIDSDQHLWAYTWGVGINELNLNFPGNQRFRRYTREEFPTLEGDFINSACEDILNDGIWLGSTRGLLFYDKRTKRFERVICEGIKDEFEMIPALLADRKKRLWVGTTRGLIMIDLHSFAHSRKRFKYIYFPYKLDNPHSTQREKICSILEDAEGTLWFGGNGSGLYRMTENNRGHFTFTNYTVSDGLPDNTVTGMAEDRQGNLWITTHDDFCRLNVMTMTFTNYTADDGLPVTQYYGNGIHYSAKYNRIFLATNAGMLMVRPDETAPEPVNRKVRFTSLTVAGIPVYPTESHHLKQYITRAASISLHESESRFSLGLTTCDYGSCSRIRFAYRLKGYEREWNETGTGDYVIRYTAVPPGDYTLQVCATDESGGWSDEVSEIKVHVVPYFYKTTWFYIGLLILSGMGGWLWYRMKLKRYRVQKVELEKKVEERTQELAVQNKQLEAMAAQVEEATEEKMTFFTNITHEFRTPVTLIHGPIEHALREVTDEGVKAQLEIAERNSRYLLSLVNELMDFRKLETNRVVLEKKSCNIVQFLSELLLPFRIFAKERGITIRLYTRLPWPYVQLDTAYMRKAMVNLVANAVKFTPDKGRIDVYVASIADQEHGQSLYINVCDTGYGIAEADLNRIFERFYQSKVNDRHPIFGQSGTGIGLFLCRKIIELHGGTINARNNPGRGASFRVRIPWIEGTCETVPEETALAALKEEKAPDKPTTEEERQRATILIVEDNRDMRAYIRTLLSPDYRLLEAEDGEKALLIIQKHNIDLIVSDLMMPVMDGMELSARVKENFATSHIPFLMLTAITSEAQQKESFEIGVDEYLCKPFDEEVLRLRIRNMLRLRDSYKRKFSVSGNVDDLNIKEDSRDKQFMNQALALMSAHYADAEYDLEHFVSDMGYSKTMVNKKMQALAGQPIGRFMKGYRLNVARKMLEQGGAGLNVQEVAYAVGFNDPKYFTKCFKEFFGHLPSTLLEEA